MGEYKQSPRSKAFSAKCLLVRAGAVGLHTCYATFIVSPNSSGGGDFASGLYVENDLPFRR
jgi:hypothetical protein